MLIALLIVLGIDLIVIVAFVVVVVGRRRWLQRQPGQFVGAVRVTNGELDGIPNALEARIGAVGPRRTGVEQGAVHVPHPTRHQSTV